MSCIRYTFHDFAVLIENQAVKYHDSNSTDRSNRARAVDRSTARESSERNEKQDQDTIQDNQTLLCLFTVQ